MVTLDMLDTELDLLCIGNVLVDVYASFPADSPEKYRLGKGVQHIGMEDMEKILADTGIDFKADPDKAGNYSVSSGGGAANVAKIAAILGLRSGFQGAAGNDKRADLFEEKLRDAGVENRILKFDEPTGVFLMMEMPGGEKRIAACPGASLLFDETHVDEEAIRGAKLAVLDGYVLDRQPLVRRVLDLADKNGTVAALDTGSSELTGKWALEIATYCRLYPIIVFMNEAESLVFYRTLAQRSSDFEGESGLNEVLSPEYQDFFRAFTSNDIFPIIVIKLGKRGAVVFAGGEMYREETLPIMPAESTGAGDAFCAAFLSAWVMNKSLSECAALGNKAAREILAVPGTEIDPKKLKHLAKLLKK